MQTAQQISPASVLLIGDPRLRQVSAEVEDVKDLDFVKQRQCLEQTLEKVIILSPFKLPFTVSSNNLCVCEIIQFRQEHGFGRAISAPQIGVNKRFIALNLGKEHSDPFCMINPVISDQSSETFTL